MAFSTIGVAKQKGGSVGASSLHNGRGRETPNADPERSHLNRVLIGDERNASVRVREIIDEHGGQPRHDSVEAVELLLSASHEFFEGRDGEISQEAVDRFCEQAEKFLNDRSNCGICAKAILHLDERTPHKHAHMVPITPDGRLSATHFLDGRKKMKELHTRYNDYMKELGLERGREGSRATHQRVKQFYHSIKENPELKIDPDKIPDPSRLKVLTAEGARQYKLEVADHVLEQLKEPIRILQDQAKLTKDAHAHRVEAEKRADEAERHAQERIGAAEREAQEKIVEGLRDAEARFQNLHRSALQLLEENKELRRDNKNLLNQRNDLHEKALKEGNQKLEYMAQARELGERLPDIPMPEVMAHLGYGGEQHGQAHIYRGENNVVAMRIEQQKAFDHSNQLICKNSVDLVVHMREFNEGVEGFSKDEAIEWLRDEFGDRRAEGAALVNRQHEVLDMFERRREGHERIRTGQELADEWQAMGRNEGFEPMRGESHDRDDGFSFDR